MQSRIFIPVGLAVALAVAGCGDDPFQINWEENPQETVLFALDREELNRPSGFNMLERRSVIVEAPAAEGRWDFAVDRQDGGFVLLPPNLLGVQSRAGIASIPGVEWDDVREAPRDTLAFNMDAPVPTEPGTIYVVRTHQQMDLFGRQCVFYGKLEPIEMDVDQGVFRFRHDTNPRCNDRSLVAPGS